MDLVCSVDPLSSFFTADQISDSDRPLYNQVTPFDVAFPGLPCISVSLDLEKTKSAATSTALGLSKPTTFTEVESSLAIFFHDLNVG